MAQVIEFYVPTHFTRQKRIPRGKQGKLLAFPNKLRTKPQLSQEWARVMTQRRRRRSNSILAQLLWALTSPA